MPALDGARGVAVVAVVVFHGGFTWARGGFLGVSTFFTLSGYLIATLLLREAQDRGGVSLRDFYLRRIRRLWPASFLALGLVALIAVFAATPSEVVDLRTDMLASLAQIVNWAFIVQGRSYADLFQTPSLVQHFWSLAIEEQFYLVLPPLLALAVSRRWAPARMAAATVLGLVASMAVSTALLLTGASTDRLYYGTDTRAFELLVGVLLALVIHQRPLGPTSARTRWALQAAGVAALLASLAAWGLVEQSSRWLYAGGLWAYALGSVALVAACLQPGPVSALLSHPLLRRLGMLSYAIYLFHWPIFLWLSPARLGTSQATAFLLGCGVTWALAELSAAFVEVPFRRGAWGRLWARRHHPALAPAGAGVAVLAVLAAIVFVVPQGASTVDDLSTSQLDDVAAEIRAREGAPVVGFFGDSTSLNASLGLAEWARETGRIEFGPGQLQIGCGIITEGDVRYGEGLDDLDRCDERDERYREAARRLDLAYMQFGPWDVADHRLPGDDQWRSMGDPIYDAAVEEEALRLIDILTAHGAVVAWVQPPRIRLGTIDGRPPARDYPTSDPERMERFRELGEDLRDARPGSVVLLDLAGWLRDQPGGEMDPTLRPDGIHFSTDVAEAVAETWLGPEIERVWARVRGRP